MDWRLDEELFEALTDYVAQNMRKAEILDIVRKNFDSYVWSARTLTRRLQYFNITYINYETDVNDVLEAVQREVAGPGKLLGIRAMNQKLRTEYGIKVPRHLTYNAMKHVDPDGLEARKCAKKKKKKGTFTSDGPMYVLSLDGHDKMYGYQKWTYPIGIYGCLDTFSRKVLYLHVVPSNSDPNVIGNMYLSYLRQSLSLPNYLRVDRGTETGKMATIQMFLTDKLDILDRPADSVIYGTSTNNKIERFWRDLHESMEKYFKEQLNYLLQNREYVKENEIQRRLIAYIYIPILQRECDTFSRYWNSHRIRFQRTSEIPAGIPNVLFACPEREGYEVQGNAITEEMILEVEAVSGLKSQMDDNVKLYVDEIEGLWEKCNDLMQDPHELESGEEVEAYRYLKWKIDNDSLTTNADSENESDASTNFEL